MINTSPPIPKAPTPLAPIKKWYENTAIQIITISVVTLAAMVVIFSNLNRTQDVSDTFINISHKAQPSGALNPTIQKIEDVGEEFYISKFPETKFVLNSVTRVDGLQPGGCDSSLPQNVREAVRVSGGCWDESVFDPKQDYTLVGVNIDVENNSNQSINGDLIKLVYLADEDDQDTLRFAMRSIDFSSYSVGPYQDRSIGMSFWIPTKQKVYLAYGLKSSPDKPLLYGQKLKQNFEGALEIDFTASSVRFVDTR